MKKKTVIIIITLILTGAIAVWYFTFHKKAGPVSLETVKPEYGIISTSVTATGTIQPVDTVTIGSQVSGTIKSIYVDFNDRVKKGQLIAELDKSLYLTTVNQYTSNLALARSNLIFQQSNFSREKQLYDSQVISRLEYETAQNQLETTKATVNSVQAQLDAAEKNLSYTNIYSPVNGVVLSRNINIGQTVAASFNTPTLFIIAKDITKMQVQAGVDEADIGNVRTGQPVVFTVDAFPDYRFKGRVREIRLQPVITANVVTYTTIIDAPNKDLKLKPGMTANIFIYTKVDSNALLIPSRALRFTPDSSLRKQFHLLAGENFHKRSSNREISSRPLPVNPRQSKTNNDSAENIVRTGTVWTKSGDSLIEKEIQTGINDDTHLQVLDGLSENDLVVLAILSQEKNSTAPVQKSPFMPTRRPTPSTKPKTSAAR
jgi:HlyD family secretion protein